jgi:hypothetical protein
MMSKIKTEQQDGIWYAKLHGILGQGRTEQEAVNRLAYLSGEASLVLHAERDYWLERWKPKTDQEAVEMFQKVFGG